MHGSSGITKISLLKKFRLPTQASVDNRWDIQLLDSKTGWSTDGFSSVCSIKGKSHPQNFNRGARSPAGAAAAA